MGTSLKITFAPQWSPGRACGSRFRTGPEDSHFAGSLEVQRYRASRTSAAPSVAARKTTTQVDAGFFDLWRKKGVDLFDQLPAVEQLELGRWNAGEAAIGFGEVEQPLTAALYDAEGIFDLVNVFFFEAAVVSHEIVEGRAQGSDGRYGVHDLMSENADQFLPGGHLRC